MRLLAFSWRALRRDWRAGALRILALAVLIAVAAVSSVSFFTDRIGRAMLHQAGELLAADLVLASARAPEARWAEEAARLGLAATASVEFRSVVLAGDAVQLAEIKAVEQGYPLRGQLRLAARPFADERPAGGPPAPGTVWLDARLMQTLGVQAGDAVEVGASALTVAAVLAYEPDRGGDLFSIAPRLMMNIEDLPASQLIQPGSTVQYRLLVAGEERALQRWRQWLAPRLEEGERLVGVNEARPELDAALTRAERFLGLAALVSVLLAAVAIVTAARRHALRQLDSTAVLRCLGASQRFVLSAFSLEVLWLGLGAAALGVAAGFAAQEVLAQLMAGLFAGSLPLPSPWPAVHGLLVGMVALLGFALPPLLALRDVPPVRVLRREAGPARRRPLAIYLSAAMALVVLMAWQARDPVLTLYVAGGTAATLLVLGGVAYGLVLALGPMRERAGIAWRFGLANIVRRSGSSVVQVVAFGLGIMVLLLLGVVRQDLLDEWRDSLPPDAPNYFLVNVLPDQVAPLREFLADRVPGTPTLYPMVRGRLVERNGAPLVAEAYEEPRAQRLVQREFNLSWSGELPPENRVVAGRWWDAAGHGTAQVSVEQGLAETLGIARGDLLGFRVADRLVRVEVTSLRTVEWDSFQVNFFVLAPPGLLDDFPAQYITSVHLGDAERALLPELVRAFPNVTVIDVDALMTRIRGIMDRVTLAVEFVFLFTLLAGLMVLYAAIHTTLDERMLEGAVLRTLGARNRQVFLGMAGEFVVLGLLAGTLAALTASVLGYVLAEYVFNLSYRFSLWLWAAGLLGGGLGVGLAGSLGMRAVLRHPPLAVLRRL